MKYFVVMTALGLLTSSAFAGETMFPNAGGQIAARVTIVVNQIDRQGFRPGDAFQAALDFESRSTESADLVIPLVAFRYKVLGAQI